MSLLLSKVSLSYRNSLSLCLPPSKQPFLPERRRVLVRDLQLSRADEVYVWPRF